MRSSIKSTGRKLAIVFALVVATASVATASASAVLPELQYALPTSGQFAGGKIVVEGTKNISVQCETVGGTFGLFAPKQFESTMILKGCSMSFFGIKTTCSSAGAAGGEVVTNTLYTRLEYITKATREVALVFNAGRKTSTDATFNCGSNEEVIRGEVIARITPVNVGTTKFTVTFKGEKGIQELTQYENEKGEKVTVSPLELVSGGAAEKSSLNSTGLSINLSKQSVISA